MIAARGNTDFARPANRIHDRGGISANAQLITSVDASAIPTASPLRFRGSACTLATRAQTINARNEITLTAIQRFPRSELAMSVAAETSLTSASHAKPSAARIVVASVILMASTPEAAKADHSATPGATFNGRGYTMTTHNSAIRIVAKP